MEEMTSAPSERVTGDIHLLSTYETQLLQMFADTKKEMAK